MIRPVKNFTSYLGILLSLSTFIIQASESIDDEAWLNDDSEFDSLEVNEGELRFIAPLSDKSVLHSETILSITADSLKSGWVSMQQCYRNLDPVEKMDVVYKYQEISGLKITSIQKIQKVNIIGQKISLEGIARSAFLCVDAMVKILKQEKQFFYLSNGPYHRKFFDGYYPYHISLMVHFPANRIGLKQITPAPQPLFQPKLNAGQIMIDTWFEGILKIAIEFIPKP